MAQGWKAVAVACLLAAIAMLAGAMRLSWRAGEIEGPSALVVTPAGEVWLGVDDALWRIGADGALREARPLSTVGLPASPANLAHGPDGRIVASVRRDPTLYVIDAAAMRVVRTIRPQWPADLAAHGGRAINFDFDPQGRVAIATGGGHAVALFDAQGTFVARTPADLYKFTNGLWWSPRGLWTTDTNRFALRLLDAASLQPVRAVELPPAAGGRFLGPARARPAAAGAESQAALIRFRNNMVDGQVSLVQPGRAPIELPGSAGMQPRDLDWLGNTLLVSDGATLTVRRWSAQGAALPAFGDAALQQRLRSVEQERQSMRRWHRVLLGLAAGVFLLGLAAALVAQRAQRRATPAGALDLSQLGTPQPGRWTLVKMNLRVNAALLAASGVVLALNALPRPWLKATLGQAYLPVTLGASGVMLLFAVLSVPALSGRLRRLARDPALEPAFNALAMNALRRQASRVAGVLRDGERVVETFHPTPGTTWWVLTSERLLGFSAAALPGSRMREHDLGDVRAVSRRVGEVAPRPTLGRLTNREAWLELKFADGSTLAGSLSSIPLVERVAQRIEATAASRRRAVVPSSAAVGVSVSGRRRWLVLASLLLPGSGHAWLRHGGQAIVLLACFAALLLFFSGPMLWTLVEPYVAVGPRAAWMAGGAHAVLGLLAAADAWRLAGSSTPR